MRCVGVWRRRGLSPSVFAFLDFHRQLRGLACTFGLAAFLFGLGAVFDDQQVERAGRGIDAGDPHGETITNRDRPAGALGDQRAGHAIDPPPVGSIAGQIADMHEPVDQKVVELDKHARPGYARHLSCQFITYKSVEKLDNDVVRKIVI